MDWLCKRTWYQACREASERCLFLDTNWLTQCCTQFKSPGVKILCVLYLHVKDMKMPETKRFFPKGLKQH